MQKSIRGFYDNGNIILDDDVPLYKGRISIIFHDEIQTAVKVLKPEMSKEEALQVLKKYKGRIERDIDVKKERLAYIDEKYGDID
ncbi:MAG: tektin family protein [Defluviitaleaceae bacterium]|nr:tektin family protein [Defluviitaleaceae bacterium]